GFQQSLLQYGYWPEAVWRDVVRTLGADPDFDRIGASSKAFKTALYSLGCQPGPDHEQIEKLCAFERRPAELRRVERAKMLPGAEESRQWLLDMIACETRELQALEHDLRTGEDKLQRESVVKMALLPGENELSRQFLRYHNEWCGKFFRAFGQLP